MDDHNDSRMRTQAPSRARFIQGAGAVGVGVLAAGIAAPRVDATAPAPADEASVQDILNVALVAEQLATTFYYTGLTTRAIAGTPQIAGASADPNRVSPNGNPANVAYLQAALDQERKHAEILSSAGAVSSHTGFYFPATTFAQLGFTSHAGTYLAVLDHLETAFISAYIAAVKRFGALGRPDLLTVALRFLGVECQHRALYRVISQDDPADNVTLEVGQFARVADAAAALAPYLTGHGFSGGSTGRIALPAAADIDRMVGRNVSM